MLRNNSMPEAASPETSNTNKYATAIKTVLRKRREKSLPSMRSNKDFDSQDSLRNKNGSNEIKSGLALKKVYNIQKVEVEKSNFMKKTKTDKSKEFDKKYHSQSDKPQNREQIKKTPKTREPKKERQRNQEKQRKEEKQRMEEKQRIKEKKRRAEKQRNTEKRRSEEKQRKRSEEKPFDESQSSQENTKSFAFKRKYLENRLTTKIWQILSRDVFLLDYDKFNSQIQASNSETKKYIISVIKKCNNKELKRLNPPIMTQTRKESLSSAGKKAIKRAVRRRVWTMAKASIKHSKHWSQFLAENNIILENINIDKFDLSLIDLDALGIENKILKRTVTWLFK